jgi:hypothetical protein
VGPTRPLSLAGTTRLSRDGRSHPNPRRAAPEPSSGVRSPCPCAAARGDTLLDAGAAAVLALSWKVHGMDAMASSSSSALLGLASWTAEDVRVGREQSERLRRALS